MFKLFKNISKKEIIAVILCIALVITNVWLELKMPDYMSQITILVQSENSKMSEILTQGGYMLLCAFGSLVCAIAVGYFAARLSSSFSLNTRKKIFNKVQNFSTSEIKKFSTSSLITRTTNDVTQIEMLIAMGLQMMLRAPIMAVWAITKIIDKSVEWSILTAACVAILLTVVLSVMAVVIPKFKIVQKLIDKVNNLTRENLTGIRVIRAFNAEKFQVNRFEETNQDLTKTQMFNQRCFSVFMPTMYLVMHCLTFGIYLIGAFLITNSPIADRITLFSDMIVFSSYGMQVIMSFLMLAFIFMMWPRAMVSATRINEVLEQEVSIKEGKFNKETSSKGQIEFKNVSFKYPDADEYLLHNISFKAEKGQTIAFIGSTGSGKSTLINLVPRFYDATEGEILVDDINVKEYTFKALNNKIGYVPQKAFMFTETVKSNINFGKSLNRITETTVKEAVKVAQAEEFVSKMDNSYDAHIARGGTNISGGQKQRLSIARAIAKKPEIYIFDDTFSALDYKTDLTLRKELKKYTKDATTLIVAQRIGTILNADKIIVLDKGKCVGIGNHKELLKSCEVYKEIALSQLSKEELENA